MIEAHCPMCYADSLEPHAGIYRCTECRSLVRFVADKPKHEARNPSPLTMIGRPGNG